MTDKLNAFVEANKEIKRKSKATDKAWERLTMTEQEKQEATRIAILKALLAKQ